jgi:RimJ/RimL family protein N-acetyltransferase
LIEIRRARFEDIPWISGELRKFSDFFGSKRKLFRDEEFTRKGLVEMIERHVLFVSDHNGVLTGFIGAYFLPHPFNPDIKLLQETFWWVAQAYRGGSSGARLLHSFIEWGKDHADWISVSLEANSPVREDALESRGFRHQESSFLMEV